MIDFSEGLHQVFTCTNVFEDQATGTQVVYVESPGSKIAHVEIPGAGSPLFPGSKLAARFPNKRSSLGRGLYHYFQLDKVDGKPFIFALGVMVTAHPQEQESYMGVRVGQLVNIHGQRYEITEEPNDNLGLKPIA